eukprot:COSAG04_NODE_98_length_26386_cov_21.212729_4_plen_180_part_00
MPSTESKLAHQLHRRRTTRGRVGPAGCPRQSRRQGQLVRLLGDQARRPPAVHRLTARRKAPARARRKARRRVPPTACTPGSRSGCARRRGGRSRSVWSWLKPRRRGAHSSPTPAPSMALGGARPKVQKAAACPRRPRVLRRQRQRLRRRLQSRRQVARRSPLLSWRVGSLRRGKRHGGE